MIDHKNSHLSPLTARFISLGTGAIGLGASAVTCLLFWVDLKLTVTDQNTRNMLMTGCVLLTLGQLATFGVAGLLPAQLMRWMRRALLGLGSVLLAFDIAGMARAQLAITHTADAAAGAATARAAELQRAIDSRRATAESHRALATTQQQAGAVTGAARSLRLATDIEASIEPLASELASVQATHHTTSTAIVGEHGMAVFAVVRAALIAVLGLVMTYVSGALARYARGLSDARRPALPQPMATPARHAAQASNAGNYRMSAATMAPLAAFAVGVPACTVPAAPAPATRAQEQAPAVPESVQQPEEQPRRPRTARQATDAGRSDTGTQDGENTRYLRVVAAVRAGTLSPSVRSIRQSERCATDVAQRYLARMTADGITRRIGRGHELIQAAA